MGSIVPGKGAASISSLSMYSVKSLTTSSFLSNQEPNSLGLAGYQAAHRYWDFIGMFTEKTSDWLECRRENELSSKQEVTRKTCITCSAREARAMRGKRVFSIWSSPALGCSKYRYVLVPSPTALSALNGTWLFLYLIED